MRNYFAGLVPSVPAVPTRPQQPGTRRNPHEQGLVPGVPAVPSKNDNERNETGAEALSEGAKRAQEAHPQGTPPEAAELDADAREHLAERQAIAEIDGEQSPDEAARMAAARVFEYRLTDEPESWFLMLARPGEGLEKVRRSLVNRFGADRVLEVRHRNTWQSTT